MRIFVTVGSMLPFDRLITTMDRWATANPDVKVFAQIGSSVLRPDRIENCAMMSPVAYREQFRASDLVVSHCGMGTVITASECNKPLVMLPRRPEMQEVTSDHQLATAKWLERRAGIQVAYHEEDVAAAIAKSIGGVGVSQIGTGTTDSLIAALRCFIEG